MRPLCELDLEDPRWGAATRFAVENEPPLGSWPGVDRSLPLFESVPFPSWVRLSPASAAAPWRTPHPRPLLVAAFFTLKAACSS